MKQNIFKVVALCLLVSIAVWSCGGESGTGTETQAQTQPDAERMEQKTEMQPEEIGQQIRDLYVESMGKLVNLLESKPEVSNVKVQVETLQEETIATMVDLGHKRETLDAADRSKVDSQIRMKMNSFYKDPVFTSFNEIQQHYFQNRDFHKLVMSFNVITQYANFDLLKKQEPEEAQRLGLN